MSIIYKKVSYFFKKKMLIVYFWVFDENGRQSPMGGWQLTPFFRFGPRIVISTSGNLGRFSQKFHGRRR